jgi:hypothetical protein
VVRFELIGEVSFPKGQLLGWVGAWYFSAGKLLNNNMTIAEPAVEIHAVSGQPKRRPHILFVDDDQPLLDLGDSP